MLFVLIAHGILSLVHVSEPVNIQVCPPCTTVLSTGLICKVIKLQIQGLGIRLLVPEFGNWRRFAMEIHCTALPTISHFCAGPMLQLLGIHLIYTPNRNQSHKIGKI